MPVLVVLFSIALPSRPRPASCRCGAAGTRRASPHHEPSRRGSPLPPSTNIACATLGRHSSLFMSQQSPERWLLTYDRNKESTEMSAKVRPPAHEARGDPNACSVLLDAGF
ncbi:hypothetical protein EVAR_50535_1 [Eumeta japonica]|uniref:Uncharacterized protein n=1 Tax=Eumeta variegata TaxID=151549 RepID=A0A4C1YSL5_EUMVA|nr:hypothetical protein EVAR_50535_1 [Eumeta japonica]